MRWDPGFVPLSEGEVRRLRDMRRAMPERDGELMRRLIAEVNASRAETARREGAGQECSTCVYWRAGTCRRRAPAVHPGTVHGGFLSHPATPADYWCGDWSKTLR